ncbi:putative quinol monooxygenase [Pleionea sediminis]|uniref:putative quinol monooxygenase n=1 Tax=Pleionea sediminis TaxID=2569479 RepID=UPI0011855B44|nr:putative quinol monooxygenase [Pleionea sediminis]
MKTLTCIAKITAKEAHKETVLSELTKIISPTLEEKGCINYDMHTDNDKDNTFIFYENWESELDLNNHMESEHIKQCFEVIGDMLDSVEISKLSKVSV